MSTRWFSLQRRLLLPLLGGVCFFWLAYLAYSYYDAHRVIDQLFDAKLAQSARVLLAISEHEALELEQDKTVQGHDYRELEKLVFQVWGRDGRLLMSSANAPRKMLTQHEGFSEVTDGTRLWRYFSQQDPNGLLRVEVGEDHAVRDELIGAITQRLLTPLLLGLPLLGAWILLATRRGLAPLDAIAAQIGERDPKHLQALTPEAAPLEIKPMLEELNSLFGHVGKALDNERRFTADAAHELRTPLAAIAAHAEVALRSTSADERYHAIEQLRRGAMRTSHLIEQLLTMARLDPEQVPGTSGPVNLGELAEEVCAAQGSSAIAKGLTFELDAKPIVINGDAALLSILLRNLVDNAIRYTPFGGAVRVRLAREQDAVVLSVTDNGPGIPAGEREQALRRFHRLAGPEQQGSGLGLSIAQRIAELHGAVIQLDDGDGGRGLTVKVRFGSPEHSS